MFLNFEYEDGRLNLLFKLQEVEMITKVLDILIIACIERVVHDTQSYKVRFGKGIITNYLISELGGMMAIII